MKQSLLATALISLLIFVRCNNGGDKNRDRKPGRDEIVAVYTRPDSVNEISIMLRIITDVKYDTVEQRNKIEWDTVWGKNDTLRDPKTQKPFLDSLGKTQFYWRAVNKDSVNWEISGIPLSILLRKGRLKNQK